MNYLSIEHKKGKRKHKRKHKPCSKGPKGGSGPCCYGKAKRSIGSVKKGACLRGPRRKK